MDFFATKEQPLAAFLGQMLLFTLCGWECIALGAGLQTKAVLMWPTSPTCSI